MSLTLSQINCHLLRLSLMMRFRHSFRWPHCRIVERPWEWQSNFAWKSKLKYDDIRYLILAEEMRMRDSSETLGSSSTSNIDTWGRRHGKNSNKGRWKERRNKDRSKLRFGQRSTCWSCGKTGHFKRNYKSLKKTENDAANVVTEEVQDALLFVVHSLVIWCLSREPHFTPLHIDKLCRIMLLLTFDFCKV